jgi:hypothetical protein
MARLATILLVLLGMACAPASQADLSTGQTLIELGDAINDLRRENSMLQEQVDSLRVALARQDTLVRNLANLAGVPR